MRALRTVALLCTGLALVARADLATSKHNLSTSGPGTITSPTESETCIFCHTPHNATPAVPLWNHATSAAAYQTYTSTTMHGSVPLGQPTGSSKLCLACHDGTVALGQTVNDGTIALNNAGPGGRMPAGSSNLGTDLRDDHPVSFVRNAGATQTVDPPPGDAVKNDNTGQVQCTACHDPHEEKRDAVTKKFLVKANQASALCTTCHTVTYWATNPSAHQSSTKTYGAGQGAHTGYTTVRDNGCESCHRPHSGTTPQRLLKFAEEQTCDRCHNGSVAAKNVSADYQKAYVHPTYTRSGIHDASEGPASVTYPLPETSPAAQRHAECADCHNSHAAYSRAATAPNVSGAIAGVWGIDTSGQRIAPALREYEICYKCHAASANKPQGGNLPSPPYTARQIVQFDVSQEFDPLNPSHHAVEAAGRNSDVPSLTNGYTTASVIYCTDCHDSDTSPGNGTGGTGPRGPHGSQYNHILVRQMTPGNLGTYAASKVALCYKCHSEASIMANTTFRYHSLHARSEAASCLVCHDPHGISASQGNATNNPYLINFDTTVVRPNGSGILRYEDRGTRHGACYLTCHGENHNPETY